MDLKLVYITCFFLLVLDVRAQRLNSWSSPQNDYNTGNSVFANWNTNTGNNDFSVGGNSDFENWNLNEPNGGSVSQIGGVYSPWGDNSPGSNFGNGNAPSGIGNSDQNLFENNWNSNSFSGNNNRKIISNSKPSKEYSTGFGKTVSSSENYNNQNVGKNSASSNWNTSTNKNQNQKSSSNSGKWQSNTFNTNNRPNSGSVLNGPGSANWNGNTNKVSPDNSVYTSWGTNIEKSSKPAPGSSNNINSFSTNWETNSFNNKPASGSSNSINSFSTNGDTNFYNNNNKPNVNNVISSSDYEDNSLYSTWGKDEQKANEIPGLNNNKPKQWETNEKNSPNDKKKNSSKPNNTKKPTNTWSSNTNNQNDKKPSNSGGGKVQEVKQSNPQNEKPPVDTSILDELDKNDWYFGSELNYPKTPLKTNLNIDVSELWNFDKKKKNNSPGRNNSQRRNREIYPNEYEEPAKNCECVNVNLCDEKFIITKDDDGNEMSPNGYNCPNPTEVCCVRPRIADYMEEVVEDLLEEPVECGVRKGGFSILFDSDDTVYANEFPWILKLESLENENINCSTSLIHAQLALTAAHCVDSILPEALKVRQGFGYNEPFQVRKVDKIILHPSYNMKNPRNDIALLVLEKPFVLTRYVNTICLPVTNDKWDLSRCFVASWKEEKIDGKSREVLKKGVVNFLPQYDCQNIMLVTDLWRNYVLHDSFVCGIEKNKKQSCLGDEGSPLICPYKKSPNTFLQIGIVSKSLNCDYLGRPGIFTNVLNFLDWINEKTFDLGLFDDIDINRS